MRPEKDLLGVAGVHYVAAELNRIGIIALPTTRNTRGVDILASNPDTGKSAEIQVKTTQKKRVGKRGWMLSKGAETLRRGSFFYVFVHLPPKKPKPDYYVVPSSTVASYVRRNFEIWAKKLGHSRKNPVRNFPCDQEPFEMKKYKDNWKILGLWEKSAP